MLHTHPSPQGHFANESVQEARPDRSRQRAARGGGHEARGGGGTVRVFRQELALEDAIGSHACSLEASKRVTNDIPLGHSLLLPVGTVNRVQTH